MNYELTIIQQMGIHGSVCSYGRLFCLGIMRAIHNKN